MLTLNHNGVEYIQFTRQDLLHAGVPEYVITDAEQALVWTGVIESRNRRLRNTDWTQMSDNKLTAEKKAEFAVYRQALRDVPQNFTTPADITWPEKPTIK